MTIQKKKIGWIIIVVTCLLVVLVFNKDKGAITIVSKEEISQPIEITRHYLEGETVLYKQPTIVTDSKELVSDTNRGESKISLTIGQQTEDIVSYVDSNVDSFNIKIKVIAYDELTGEISIQLSYRGGLEKISKKITFK